MSKQTMRRREMERLLDLREREGRTLRELSERTGIPAGTLGWWSQRLRRESRAGCREIRVGQEGAPPQCEDSCRLAEGVAGGSSDGSH